MSTSPKIATQSKSLRDGSEIDLDYAFGRIRNNVFDSVLRLFKERKKHQNLTLEELGLRMGGRKKSWVSRELSGPGNWTLRTWSDFIEALDGQITEIKVEKIENIVVNNYNFYKDDYLQLKNKDRLIDINNQTYAGIQPNITIEFKSNPALL